MVKGNPKTSASSGTRKKHLKKHGPATDPEPIEKKPKGKSQRGQKKEPRVKMYIPPVKPAPVQPDPLETTGLAHTLPADLLVVLRNISKKAQVTKTRALEELQSAWVNQCLSEGPESLLTYVLVEMLPVWLHHVSALFVNPSRRVRLLTASLHSTLLQIPPIRDQIVSFLLEGASESQLESLLGTWCLATHDIDRPVAVAASKSWKETILTSPSEGSSSTRNILLSDELRTSLSAFVQRAALDPSGMYAYLNPVPPPPPPSLGQNKRGGKAGALVNPRKDDGDLTSRSKLDEQEESETDRNARLRIGALGAARWILSTSAILSEDLQAFYSNPALWSILHSKESCSWVEVESFGFAQPNVRKAGWGLVQTLFKSENAKPLFSNVEHLVPVIGTAILRSAWIEVDSIVQGTMWQPLLIFLKLFPQCWTLDTSRKNEDDGSGSEADSDTEDKISSPTETESSQAYKEFLYFLQSGCSGSPTQGYPAVVVIVSTIPSTVIASSTPDASPLSNFFAYFWGAVDSRALSSLHRVATSAAFLSSLLECIVFLIKRNSFRSLQQITPEGSSSAIDNSSEALVREQFSRVWAELTSGKLKVEDRAAARLLAQTLEALLKVDQRLVDAAWDTLATSVLASVTEEGHTKLVSVILKGFYDRFRKEDTLLKERANNMMIQVLEGAVERCEQVLVEMQEVQSTGSFILLVNVFDQFREGMFFDAGFSNRLDSLFSQSASRILVISPSLLLSYLVYRKNEMKSLSVWHSLLSSIASSAKNGHIPGSKQIGYLLEAARKGSLPNYLQPQAGELDNLVDSTLKEALDGPMGSDQIMLVTQVLKCAGYFISATATNTFSRMIVATFTSNVTHLINGEEAQSPHLFDVAIGLIKVVFDDLLKQPDALKTLLPDIHLFSYLLQLSSDLEDADIPSSSAQVAGQALWQEWIEVASEDDKIVVTDVIKRRLKAIMEDPKLHPLPEEVLNMLSRNPQGVHIDLVQDIFPSAVQLDATLDTLAGDAIDLSIQVLDPLVPPASDPKSSKKIQHATSTDQRGFSAYARIVNALAQAFLEDRQLAKCNLWALRHLLALSIYAQDLQNVPSSSSKSPVFDDKVTPRALTDIVIKVKQVSVYLFNSALGKDVEKWRSVVLIQLLNPETARASPKGLTQLQKFLFDVVTYARDNDTVRDSRVLKMVLEPLLMDGLESAEADMWVQLSRRYERQAPQTAMTIISLITASGSEPPQLDKYRNELAAGLLGIKSSRANTDGLLSLRRLAVSAPDPEGVVIFLPSPRAVNVVKACQAWVLAEEDDEELDEEVESAMLPVFMHLAPILQNIPGGHWAFVFDVLEAVLERAGSTDEEEEEAAEASDETKLVALANVLRLISVLEELAKRNKALMAEWSERRLSALTVIRDLAILGNDREALASLPRSACRELVLSVIQHLPSSLIDQDTLPKMCHLIEDPSPSVQKMAYQLLKVCARKRTEYFVIEAGVNTESVVQASLPSELLEILQRELHLTEIAEEAQGAQGQHLFGYLLGWMLVFDLFQDASFKVKSSYIEQLRNTNIVLDHFIPCFLSILHLDQGGLTKTFKLDLWAIDQFHIELYEPGSFHTIPVLVAHVYYLALLNIPSLIHGWALDCKDRQLTSTVTTYTSTYFSPVLIRTELEHVRSHASTGGLADDSMSIKVASAVNEVAAAYSVDDHQLEIKLRIPSDWPLHKIEVRDVKRVGVDENRWRAWVLGVQQTIWAHNGRIVDGLGLFKKNVTLHFEGQVECAICYSIISVMDGTLPKKPCKTCKNRFHAGCLYKWFNTSHSSSCPLCRSDII